VLKTKKPQKRGLQLQTEGEYLLVFKNELVLI